MQCSNDTQTYSIVAHFNLKGRKTKIEPQNIVNSYLPLQKVQGLAGVDFRSVNF